MESDRDVLQGKLQELSAVFRESQLQIDSLLETPRPAAALRRVIDCNAVATGTCAHAEGQGTLAEGSCAHAEGGATTASGDYSHAEGGGTTAHGNFSHAAGAVGTDAVGEASHAEGLSTRAVGDFSHAEGGVTSAIGPSSHAEGANTRAEGGTAHAEGSGTVAQGVASHAEGSLNVAQGLASHVEGRNARADGYASHAEGSGTVGQQFASHAEGMGTVAIGQAAHSEGYLALARGAASHAGGLQTEASGVGSHAIGLRTLASGDFSHAEGDGTSTGGLPGVHIMGKSGSADAAWSWFLANGLTSSGVEGIAAGNPDLFWVTGSVYPEIEPKLPAYPFKSTRILFRSLGNGKFEELLDQAGSGVASMHASRGCAFGDFDNDGDVDILILNLNESPSLLRNDVTGGNAFLKVKLIGTKSNRSAVGARVTAHYGGKIQAQEVLSQASFYSANDLRLHFGLGKAEQADLTIRWPNGGIEQINKVPANRLVTIREGAGIIKTDTLGKK